MGLEWRWYSGAVVTAGRGHGDTEQKTTVSLLSSQKCASSGNRKENGVVEREQGEFASDKPLGPVARFLSVSLCTVLVSGRAVLLPLD